MIKLIASDIDGTFLRTDRTYDEELFAKVYKKMQERNIQFVIASGNQYNLLRSLFPSYSDIIYVAENGANIRDENTTYEVNFFSQAAVEKIFKALDKFPTNELRYLVCGDKVAHVLSTTDSAFIKESEKYYKNISVIDSYDQIDDNILKFSVNCDKDKTEEIMAPLRKELDGIAEVTSSGHGDFDIIQTNLHKAAALEILGEKLGIELKDMVAFGDGGNDIEMLREVGLGVAMGNAYPDVVAVSDDRTGTNDEDGVLTYIDKLLK